VNLTPDERELWVVDGVYGYVYVYDATVLPPSRVATIPLFEDVSEEPRPTWVSFSLDGRFAYPSSGQVIDTQTREIVARVAASEKLVEIDFLDGIPVAAGAR
jgi:DNA-binding beta-propeller fold protein YncE